MNWYYVPGAHKIKGRRMTLLARFRLWQRRRHVCDLYGVGDKL